MITGSRVRVRLERRLGVVWVACAAVMMLGFATASSSLAAPTGPIGASCAPKCTGNLVQRGTTPVTQSSPTIYLIFWGSHWANAKYAAHTEVKNAQVNLFTALGGNAGNAAKYNAILEQYLGKGKNVPTYGGAWVDMSEPPATLESSNFSGEIDNALGANAAWSAGENAQFVIYPEEKNSEGQRIKVTFAGEEKPDFCGYHDHATSLVAGTEIYDVEPWLGGNAACLPYGSGTGATQVARAMSTVATHEYAEAATDPFWNDAVQKAWQTEQEGLFEIGDLCAYQGVNVAGLGYVQYLWSNAANEGKGACVI
jgi:hypothetical protein